MRNTPEDTSFTMGPFSQEAYDRAFEYDVVDDDPLQAELTEKRLLPEMGAIVDGVRRIRDIVDKRFLATMKQSGPSAAYGVLSQRDYPVGFCGIIRDTIFNVLDRSPVFTALQQEGVLLKKIYVILEGQYLQNAIQKERMCVEFKEAGTTKSLVDFIEAQLERQGHLQDRADGILFSLAMKAYEQFNRKGIGPNSKSVAALRTNGAIPTIRPKHW